MENNTALQVLIEATNVGLKNGLFGLVESRNIIQALDCVAEQFAIIENSNLNPLQELTRLDSLTNKPDEK